MTDADSVTGHTPANSKLMEQHVSEQYGSAPETDEDVTTPEELEVTPEPAEGVEATPDEREVAEVPSRRGGCGRDPPRRLRTSPPRSSTRWRRSAAS